MELCTFALLLRVSVVSVGPEAQTLDVPVRSEEATASSRHRRPRYGKAGDGTGLLGLGGLSFAGGAALARGSFFTNPHIGTGTTLYVSAQTLWMQGIFLAGSGASLRAQVDHRALGHRPRALGRLNAASWVLAGAFTMLGSAAAFSDNWSQMERYWGPLFPYLREIAAASGVPVAVGVTMGIYATKRLSIGSSEARVHVTPTLTAGGFGVAGRF